MTTSLARRVVGALVGLVVAILVLVFPPVHLWDRLKWRADFGTWDATARTPRVDFCGHHLYPDGQGDSLAYLRADLIEPGRPSAARTSFYRSCHHRFGASNQCRGSPGVRTLPRPNCHFPRRCHLPATSCPRVSRPTRFLANMLVNGGTSTFRDRRPASAG